jgi:hypothetical protein
MPGFPTKVRKGRMRTKTTTISNIKKIEGECAKLCEENAQVWTKLIEDLEMMVVDAKIREAKEQAQHVVEREATLPSIACMSAILYQ